MERKRRNGIQSALTLKTKSTVTNTAKYIIMQTNSKSAKVASLEFNFMAPSKAFNLATL